MCVGVWGVRSHGRVKLEMFENSGLALRFFLLFLFTNRFLANRFLANRLLAHRFLANRLAANRFLANRFF